MCFHIQKSTDNNAYLQLTAAYRSLSRLSSAPDAKAFSLCSCLLELLLMYPLKDTVITCSLYQELLSYLKQFVFGFLLAIYTITCVAKL